MRMYAFLIARINTKTLLVEHVGIWDKSAGELARSDEFTYLDVMTGPVNIEYRVTDAQREEQLLQRMVEPTYRSICGWCWPLMYPHLQERLKLLAAP